MKLTELVNDKKEAGLLTSKFLTIDHEKQQRILNAAIKEFAQKGYANASTNEIVKEAGISKGLLFHYFKNKKELYLYLYNHFVNVLKNEFFGEINLQDRDIFVRLKAVTMLKSQLIKKHPDVFNFMMSAYQESSVEVKSELDQRHRELLQTSYGTVFDNIDTEKFKKDIDITRAINIISWTLEGFSNQAMERERLAKHSQADFTYDFSEADVYIEQLKVLFYK